MTTEARERRVKELESSVASERSIKEAEKKILLTEVEKNCELQRRVEELEELEEGLRWITRYINDLSAGFEDVIPLRRIKAKAEFLLSSSGAPKEKP